MSSALETATMRDQMTHRAAAAACVTSIAGLLLLISPLHLAGALLLLAGVVAIGLLRPTWALWLVLLLFAVHPLSTKIAEVNFGVTGMSLILFSAWKEAALAAALLAEFGALAALYRAGHRPRLQPALMDMVGAAFVVLIVVGFVGRHDALALNQVRLLLFPVGVYVAIRLRPVDTSVYFKAMTIIAVPIALFAIVQSEAFGWSFVGTYWGTPSLPIPSTFTAQHLVGPRAAGMYGSPNELGFALSAWGFMAAALVAMNPLKRRWVALALVPILVALAVTFSRSAIVACAVSLVVLLVAIGRLSPSPRRALTYLSLAIVPVIVLSGGIYFARGGTALIASTIASISFSSSSADTGAPGPGDTSTSLPSGGPVDPSTQGHLDSLSAAWSMVASHPLGIGLGTVGSRGVPETTELPQYVLESYYLSMGVMLGWLGLGWAVLFALGLLITAGRAIRRGSTTVGLALLALSISLAIVSYWLPTIMEPEMAILPWSLAALAVSPLTGIASGASASTGTAATPEPAAATA